MKYKTMIQIIVQNNDKTEFERGDNLIKDMNRLSTDILNYRYTVEHYKGNSGTVLKDEVNKIKNSMAILWSDFMIYAEILDITDKIEEKAHNRIDKIARRRE